VAWRKNDPNLTNNPLYLEPRVSQTEAGLADVQNKIGILNKKTDSFVSVAEFGAVGDYVDGVGGTNNYQAFQDAANRAKELNATLIIPKGRYYISGTVNIFTSVYCFGEIIIKNDESGYVFRILPTKSPITLNATTLTGLTEGSIKLDGIPSGYRGSTLVITSTEELIKRNNPPSNIPYTRNDTAILIDNDGGIMPCIDTTYEDLTKVTAYIQPKEQTIYINGLKITAVGDVQSDRGFVYINRSNVILNGCQFYNNSDVAQIHTAVNIAYAANITFNNVEIAGARHSGYGYGVSVGYSSFVTFNDCHIHDCRHALTGRHGKAVSVNGGSYSDDIDSHWGVDYVIDGATIFGSISYAGKDITLRNSTMHVSYHVINLRTDTPELRGKVLVENNNLILNEGASYMVLYYSPTTTSFDWVRELGTPDLIRFANNVIDSKTKYVITISMGGGFAPLHQPVRRIELESNQYIGNPRVNTILWKNADKQQNVTFNPKLIIRNEKLGGGTSNGQETLVIRDDSTTITTTWGWDILVENCDGYASRLDDTAYIRQEIRGGRVVRIDKVNIKGQTLGEVFLYHCVLDNAVLLTEGNAIHLIGCKVVGSSGRYSWDRIKLSFGNVQVDGAVGLDNISPLNFVDPVYYKSMSKKRVLSSKTGISSGSTTESVFLFAFEDSSESTIRAEVKIQPSDSDAIRFKLTIDTGTKTVSATEILEDGASPSSGYTFSYELWNSQNGLAGLKLTIPSYKTVSITYIASTRYNYLYEIRPTNNLFY
jgi:hypothetical protein